jgi:hypothetical protein
MSQVVDQRCTDRQVRRQLKVSIRDAMSWVWRCDWSSDVCSSDLPLLAGNVRNL